MIRREAIGGGPSRSDDGGCEGGLALVAALKRALDAGAPFDEILRAFSIGCGAVCGSDRAALYLLDDESGALIADPESIAPMVVQIVEDILGLEFPDVLIAPKAGSWYGRVLESEVPVVTSDPDLILSNVREFDGAERVERLLPGLVKALGIGAIMAARVCTGDKVLGLVDLSRKTPFTDEEADCFGDLVEVFAAIVERARRDGQPVGVRARQRDARPRS